MIKLIKSTFFNERDTKKKLLKFIDGARYLSFGKQCEIFERAFAVWQGRKDCVLLNSGSSANLAIIQALVNLKKLKPGDRVGFSAVTWSTNVMPLIQLGLQPIPIDVELDTLNVSSKKFLQTLGTYKLKMLFLTNLLGFCGDIDEISKICNKNGILFIEDNCESLGTVYKKKKLGNYGLASTVSFYVGHHISTIEGGAVVTDDEELATMLRLVRAHGWDRNLSFAKQAEMRKKFKVNSTFYSRYTFYDLGYNLRPTEITGFLGTCQLKYIDRIIRRRNENYLYMASRIFRETDKYYPLKHSHIDVLSNFAVPVICKSTAIRDALVQKCAKYVEIRPVVGGDMVSQPFFDKYVKKELITCKNARIIHQQGLYFGNNPELTKKEMDLIIRIFTDTNI